MTGTTLRTPSGMSAQILVYMSRGKSGQMGRTMRHFILCRDARAVSSSCSREYLMIDLVWTIQVRTGRGCVSRREGLGGTTDSEDGLVDVRYGRMEVDGRSFGLGTSVDIEWASTTALQSITTQYSSARRRVRVFEDEHSEISRIVRQGAGRRWRRRSLGA
ncbi:hypothetical protein OH77DRAFT_1229310 [Trametes cingulata]|nr:hypothetical protein OH77DRAFT_1229310 [Trametes cingulata]